MQVNCVNSPLPGLGDSSITVLPCAFPRPSLNLLVLNENGDVLGNFTSYKDETNQNLTEGGVNVYSLDWIVRYNKADSSLTFQVSLYITNISHNYMSYILLVYIHIA